MSNLIQRLLLFSIFTLPLSQITVKTEEETFRKIASNEMPSSPYEYRYSFSNYSVSIKQEEDRIFLYVDFLDETEKRTYKSWQWDAINQSYIESNDEESIFAIILRSEENNNSSDTADIWLWRAFMSDPAELAEDFYAIIKNNRISKLERDAGALCWEPIYYENFKGEKLPRFKHKTPSGSYADVSAKGIWKDGHWKIIFSRKLNTEHPDDIVLEKNKKYSFFFCVTKEKILNFSDLDKITITIR
ncbi:MAG TPA: ethylbenzene dehydrogenase-related protein [Victivallales bacterium]|nr:ethylbenzene dehydrogenase-related protein [Victivallales bacterium]HRR28574.1 ethylbenzene dehydrogenase-related protein [Victivallales bacterium]